MVGGRRYPLRNSSPKPAGKLPLENSQSSLQSELFLIWKINVYIENYGITHLSFTFSPWK